VIFGKKFIFKISPRLFIFRDREYAQSIEHLNAQKMLGPDFLKNDSLIFFWPFTEKVCDFW